MVLWRDLAPEQAPGKVNRNTLRLRYFVAFSRANRPPIPARVGNELLGRARADFGRKSRCDPHPGVSAGGRHYPAA